jgi:outer membrane protein OmpA-like peptidoglycan-associated protein
MRRLTGPTVAVIASTFLTGCLATQSQLKNERNMQNLALSEERAARISSDSALAQQLGMVQGDVRKLRDDLQTMRSEFGAKIVAMEDGLHFALPVTFDFNATALRDETQPALARFAKIATSYYPGSKITVEGFADPAGSTQYNLSLSKRRAEAVRQYLVGQAGLTTNEVNAVGYGETRLVTPGAWGDKPGADLNRRVVFVIESQGNRTVAMSNPAGQ